MAHELQAVLVMKKNVSATTGIEPIEGTGLLREIHEHDFSDEHGNGNPYWACTHVHGDGVRCPLFVTVAGAGAPPGVHIYKAPEVPE